MKKRIFIFVLICILLLTTSCARREDVSAEQTTAPTQTAEAGLTSQTIANHVEIGMKYSTLCDLFGTEGTDAASGVIAYEWELDDGKYFRAHFINSHEEPYPQGLTLQSYSIREEPWNFPGA